MDLVIDYSKNQKFMPPKATWFEPKPLDVYFFITLSIEVNNLLIIKE